MTALKFLSKHWLTLLLFVGAIIGVNYFVSHRRAPGAMTVIEAQSMDMTTMSAPTGATPVAAEPAGSRATDTGVSYPATVAALQDEDVVARVPGRVTKILVYPGDKVRAGQLLAVLDAPELDATQRSALDAAQGKQNEAVAASQQIAIEQAGEAQARAGAQGARAAYARAQADLAVARLEVSHALHDVGERQADVVSAQASLTYAKKSLNREAALYKGGAISLDEYQISQRDISTASARLEGANMALLASRQMVDIAKARATSARKAVEQARAEINAATAMVTRSAASTQESRAQLAGKVSQANAARAMAAGASSIAGYRELRALSAGVVSERVVSPGTPVQSGQVILKLRDILTVRVQADLPEGMATTVKPGTRVVITAPNYRREAALTSISPSIDPQTRTIRVEALISNSGRALTAGQFVQVALVSGSQNSGLVVRQSALQMADSGPFVWVMKTRPGTGKQDWTCTMHPEVSETGPGKCPKCSMDLTLREKGGAFAAHRQSVTVGKSGATYVPILSGLKQGDLVIWAGLENLIEGTSVVATPWGTSGPTKLPPPTASSGGMADMPGMNMQGQP